MKKRILLFIIMVIGSLVVGCSKQENPPENLINEETELSENTENKEETKSIPEDYYFENIESFYFRLAIPDRWHLIDSGIQNIYVNAKDQWILIGAYESYSMNLETNLKQLPIYFSKILLSTLDIGIRLSSDDTNADPNFQVVEQQETIINGRTMLCAEGSFDLVDSGKVTQYSYKGYYLLYTKEEEEYYDFKSEQFLPIKDIPVYFMIFEQGDKLSEELSEIIDVMANSFTGED